MGIVVLYPTKLIGIVGIEKKRHGASYGGAGMPPVGHTGNGTAAHRNIAGSAIRKIPAEKSFSRPSLLRARAMKKISRYNAETRSDHGIVCTPFPVLVQNVL